MENFDDMDVKCKGARLDKKPEGKSKLRDSFVRSLKTHTKENVEFYRFSARNQKLSMVHETRSSIASFCDKRKLLTCMNHTQAYGYNASRNPSCEASAECDFLTKYFNCLYPTDNSKIK